MNNLFGQYNLYNTLSDLFLLAGVLLAVLCAILVWRLRIVKTISLWIRRKGWKSPAVLTAPLSSEHSGNEQFVDRSVQVDKRLNEEVGKGNEAPDEKSLPDSEGDSPTEFLADDAGTVPLEGAMETSILENAGDQMQYANMNDEDNESFYVLEEKTIVHSDVVL